MALSNSFWGTSSSPTPTPTPVQPSAKPQSGGVSKFLGGLYDATVRPFEKGVQNVTSDLAGLGGAAGTAVKDVAQGKRGDPMVKAYLNSTPVGQAASTQTSTGKKIEAGVGSAGSDVLNAVSPLVGGEELAGKTGLRLVGNSVGVGAKLGAAGGVSSAVSQGGSGKDVFTQGVEGGGYGALAGLAGGTVAGVAGSKIARNAMSGTGKVASGVLEGITGKSPAAAGDVAGAGAGAASGNIKANVRTSEPAQMPTGPAQMPTGPVGKTAANYTQSKVIDQAAQDLTPFNGLTSKVREGTSSDGRTGLNNVVKFAKQMNMPTDANNVVSSLHTIHEALTGENGALSGANRQILAGTGEIQLPDVLGDTKAAIGKNAGALGDIGRSTTGAASSALNEVRNVLNAHLFGGSKGMVGNTTHADANDILDTIQELERSANNKPDTDTGNAMTSVLKAAASSLEKSLASGADRAVGAFKLAPEDEEAIAQMIERKGGTPELAQYAVDAANKSGRVRELRSSQAMAVRAGELADAADKHASGAIPKPQGGGNAFQGYATGLEAGQVLRGEPTGLIPLAMRFGGKAVGATAAKLSPSGAQAGEQLGQEALTGTRPAPSPEDVISRMTGGNEPVPEPAPGPAPPAPTPTNTVTKAIGRLIGERPAGAPVSVHGPIPETQAQPLGVRANVQNPQGEPRPVVNGISGPVQNSGSTMGAESQPAINLPTHTIQSPSEATPIPTRLAPEPTGTGQASGPVQTHIQPGTAGGFKGINAVGYRAGSAARTLVDRTKEGVGRLPGAVSGAARAVTHPNLSSLIGALTGEAANQAGQNGLSAGTSSSGGQPPASSDVPTQWVTADQLGPTIDENSIPGGTLADLSNEIQADPKNATMYKDIYDAAQAKIKSSVPKAPTAAQAQGATAIQDAFSLIDSVEQEFQDAGGANHAAGYEASLPIIGQHLQPAIYGYNKTKFDAATALAKALSGRAATSATLKMALDSLPNATDSAQSASAKLANVRRDLAGKAPNYGLVPAGGQ